MNFKRKALNFIMIIIMLLGNLCVCPLRADAREAFSREDSREYDGIVTSEPEVLESDWDQNPETNESLIAGFSVGDDSEPDIYLASDNQDITAYIRDVMTNRIAAATVQIKYEETVSGQEELKDFLDEKKGAMFQYFSQHVFDETESAVQGDYLRWHYRKVNLNSSAGISGGVITITYVFTMTYRTTLEEEMLVTAEIERLLSEGGIADAYQNGSDYDKIKAVYDYIHNSVVYGTETNEDFDNHTVYSALLRHDAVCQGIAAAIYRLLREMDIDCRFIANDTHGWNIVCLDGKYYNLDATWDLNNDPYRYFLKGSDSFYSNHVPKALYLTDEFKARYPVSAADYTAKDSKEEPDEDPLDKENPDNNPSDSELKEPELSEADIQYMTHVQTYGWQNYVSNGMMSGTSKEAKRLEAIKIKVSSEADLGVVYTTHCQTYGWMPWCRNGEVSGTIGEAKRLEAVKIKLTGKDADQYDIYYRVHCQSYGWMDWAKNGEPAGTAGYAKRLEAIEIVLVKKGEQPPVRSNQNTSSAFISKDGTGPYVTGENTPNVGYMTHVQTYGWQTVRYNGAAAGTSGEAKRLEGIRIFLSNTEETGDILYRTHIQTYGWENNWRKNGELSGTSGKAKRLEAIQIKLTGELAEKYDVYYRVHVQTYGWTGWVKNGETAGTSGESKRLEAIEVKLVPKGK